jgi:hypothetical protein
MRSQRFHYRKLQDCFEDVPVATRPSNHSMKRSFEVGDELGIKVVNKTAKDGTRRTVILLAGLTRLSRS